MRDASGHSTTRIMHRRFSYLTSRAVIRTSCFRIFVVIHDLCHFLHVHLSPSFRLWPVAFPYTAVTFLHFLTLANRQRFANIGTADRLVRMVQHHGRGTHARGTYPADDPGAQTGGTRSGTNRCVERI